MKTRIIQTTPDEPPRPPDRPRTNLAGRMGRWSAHHRKTAIFGWLGFVVVAFVVGTMVGATKIDNNTSGVGESGRADRILDAGFKQPAGETVLIQSETVDASDPAFQAVVADVVAKVSAFGFVEHVRSPIEPGNEGQVSPNGRAALVDFDVAGDAIDAPLKINPVVAAVADIQKANPQFFVGEFGDASTDKQIEGAFLDDLAKAGMLSLPVTLIILVVVFGSLVAAGIPLLLALTAIFATFGLIAIPSSLVPIDETVYELILLIGLAVGVDYSMFYLKREREERALGRSEEAALEAAAATSGRSVLISGLTVIIAMAGMFFAGIQGMTEFGLGTIMVVAVAMFGSLTVLPAVLAWLGDRVDKGRVPFVGRLRRDGSDGRIWGAIIDRVLRRPLVSIALSGGLLVALALPALQLHIVNASPETFPANLPVIKTYKQLQKSFPGDGIPATVVVKAEDVRSPEAQSAIADLKRRALASDQLNGPITVDINRAGTVASIVRPRGWLGLRQRVQHVARSASRRHRARHGRQDSRRRGRRVRVHRRVEGLQRQDQGGRPTRLRIRARVRLRPPAVRVPVARARGEGDRPQPDVRCSCLRSDGPRVPAWLWPGAARLRLHRRHRLVPADLHLRDPVRAFDGLPRVHPEPDPRGL